MKHCFFFDVGESVNEDEGQHVHDVQDEEFDQDDGTQSERDKQISRLSERPLER